MNSLTRMSGPPVGTQQGGWVWDGSNWVCDPDCGNGSGFPSFGPPVFSGPTQQPPWYPGANGGVSFGATAPPNPVRGHMWWNGTTFYLFDGAAWAPIGGTGSGGGAATGSTPPANPFNGQQWFNGSTLFVWDGNAWVPVSTTKSSVQPTAPPSPNPGDLWFDGQVQRIWSGSAWVLVGPGATVGPVATTTKVFQLTMGGVSLAIGAGVFTIVPFTSTPQIDTQAGWNPTTHKYQPNLAGNYFFTTNFYNPTAGTWANYLLFNDAGSFNVNSQAYVCGEFSGATTNQAGVGFSSGIVHLNGSTDFVRLWAYASDGNFWQASTAIPTIVAWILP
jgi:hypothetical protein